MGKTKILCGLILIALLVSCGSTAPFAERDAASKSIDMAKSVEAEKYAPTEFNAAVSEYDGGQNLIVEEGKSKQNDEAKAKYLEADKQAQAAYGKAVGPYFEGFIQKTEEEIEKARTIKTDVARAEQFNEAVSKNALAKESYNNKNYEQTKTASLEAYDIIRQAQVETLELREQAMVLDDEYANLLAELKEQKAEAAIPDEYAEATDNYNDINSQFEEGYYEEVVDLYYDGIEEAKDLQIVIEEKRLLALESLEDAEQSIEEAKIKTQEVESE